MGGTGFEQPASSLRKQGFGPSRAAIRAAVPSGNTANPAESGDPLARLAAAWRCLTEADQAEVVALAERLAGPLDAIGGPLSRSSGRMAGISPGDLSAR